MKSGGMRSRIALSVLALLAACTLGWSGAATARTQPAVGRFLVATRQQQGFFSGTVILLLAYGPDDGAFGVVINRPTKLKLAKLLPDMRALQGRTDTLYLGGPVAFDSLTLLIRSQAPPPDALHVVDDVYASGSLKTLHVVAGDKLAGARFRGYAGYAGWVPGQLDAELEQGAWIVVPANADDVFTTTPEKLWDKLIQQQDLQLVQANRPAWYGNSRTDLRWSL